MLVCVECGSAAAGSAGRWGAYLSYDEQIGIYLPACAKHQLGEDKTGWPDCGCN